MWSSQIPACSESSIVLWLCGALSSGPWQLRIPGSAEASHFRPLPNVGSLPEGSGGRFGFGFFHCCININQKGFKHLYQYLFLHRHGSWVLNSQLFHCYCHFENSQTQRQVSNIRLRQTFRLLLGAPGSSRAKQEVQGWATCSGSGIVLEHWTKFPMMLSRWYVSSNSNQYPKNKCSKSWCHVSAWQGPSTIDKAMQLMNLAGMPEDETWSKTPLVTKPKTADTVAHGLELTPPPVVNQQSEPWFNSWMCTVTI